MPFKSTGLMWSLASGSFNGNLTFVGRISLPLLLTVPTKARLSVLLRPLVNSTLANTQSLPESSYKKAYLTIQYNPHDRHRLTVIEVWRCCGLPQTKEQGVDLVQFSVKYLFSNFIKDAIGCMSALSLGLAWVHISLLGYWRRCLPSSQKSFSCFALFFFNDNLLILASLGDPECTSCFTNKIKSQVMSVTNIQIKFKWSRA